MFEISGDDIAALNDGDLRSLVALLCEAELRSRGLPTSAVTAGGNQDAADGGVDVRVALPADTAIEGFVPRPNTAFQVKVPDMPPSAILPEMKPSGTIRPTIQELADLSGAYIIVSSTGSTSDKALQDRRAAAKGSRNDQVLRGFLSGLQERDPSAVKAALDEAVEHETLAPLFPALQTAVPIDGDGVKRIKQSLSAGTAPAENFRIMAWGRASAAIPAANLKEILLVIAAAEDGLSVAIEILYMRIHSDKDQKKDIAPEIVAQEKARLAKEIEAERRSETKRDRDMDERFE